MAQEFLVCPYQLLIHLGRIGIGQGEFAGHPHDCFLVAAFLVPIFIEITEEAFADGKRQAVNWLRVLGTAEFPQIDQGVRHQFHAKVSLLHVFKTKNHRLNLSSQANVRSTRVLNAWMASLNNRFRPRFVVFRWRGFSLMFGIMPALKTIFRLCLESNPASGSE